MVGGNTYTEELLQLEQCAPMVARPVAPQLAVVKTPLRVRAWERALVQHPDGEFVKFVLRGIAGGFRIGFNYQRFSCKPARSNMKSAAENADVVKEYLFTEQSAGRVIGPLALETVPFVQISPFGVIPKSEPGKWRLIVDLPLPEGVSVNDGISKELCSLSYVRVDDIVPVIHRLGRGTLLAKLDIQAAYRMVPVHPDDRQLLGMIWKGCIYIDTALPFGLRSAPKIFNSIADGLEWVMKARGVRNVSHYLDDYIIMGSPKSTECGKDLEKALAVCSELGVPVAPHKCVGPLTRITFLGIEVDTVALELRLPGEKLEKLRQLIVDWQSRKSCKKQDLESLTGHLCHACKVVRPGRRFLRGMFDLLARTKKQHHFIRLNEQFPGDLEWWWVFLKDWNGVSMLYSSTMEHPDVSLCSDASGSWGCGAVWNNRWFQLSWQEVPEFEKAPIAAKELFPIVLAAALWGKEWGSLTVLCNCDNEAVVASIRAGKAKKTYMAHLLRCLFFIEAKFCCTITSSHVLGKLNERADALSRNQLSCFLSLTPKAERQQVPGTSGVGGGTGQVEQLDASAWRRWFSTI